MSSKTETRPEMKPPVSEKPTGEHKEKTDIMTTLKNLFGVFKNLFGCIKNGEELYKNNASQLQGQVPTQVSVPNPTQQQNTASD